MFTKEIVEFLEKNEFIVIGTCSDDMQPNVAPKFLLKVEGDCIFLGDYTIDRTWSNINFNPKVSLSSIDLDSLVGYQINGVVELVEEGDVYESLIDEFNTKKISLSTKRVIDGVHKEKPYKEFEMIFPERVIIYKIKAKEIIKIRPTGEVERKKV